MVGGYRDSALFCRVRRRLCALPTAHVAEVMRPLAVEELPGAPVFVLGLCILRGAPALVVDLAQLFGERRSKPAYFISAGEADRRIALAVDSVLGVRPLPGEAGQAYPSILESAAAGFVSSIRVLGDEALLVLRGSKIVPQAAWDLVKA